MVKTLKLRYLMKESPSQLINKRLCMVVDLPTRSWYLSFLFWCLPGFITISHYESCPHEFFPSSMCQWLFRLLRRRSYLTLRLKRGRNENVIIVIVVEFGRYCPPKDKCLTWRTRKNVCVGGYVDLGYFPVIQESDVFNRPKKGTSR